MELSTRQPSRFRFQSRRPHEAHGVIANFFEPCFKLEVEDRRGFDFSLDYFPCGSGVSISRLAFRADHFSGSNWLRLTSYLLGELDRKQSIFMSPLAASQAGQLLMSTLLLHQPHNYSQLLLKAPIGQVSPRLIRDAEDYLESHADQPITTADLARHLGISTRSVYLAFRRHLDTTPMERLKAIRLERVRADLLAGRDGTTVTSIAMHWGFTHLGKFASEYRARFGELPSDTLRTARKAR